MATQTHLMTADDLLRLPDDGSHYELVKGELREMAPGAEEHGSIAGRIHALLGYYIVIHNLGEIYSAETGFVIASDPDTVLAPDIAFVSQERIDAMGVSQKFRRGTPDLVVEVISPNDIYKKVDEKVADWLAAGTRLIWVVNPRHRTITVHQPNQSPVKLTVADQLDGGDVVPGWSMAVREAFR